MRIAIIGSGISGMTAAHQLHREHEITVFEADSRTGGHANTVDVTLDGQTFGVDTGFIVFNEVNYPGFTGLLDELGVAHVPTEMSFSVSDGAALEYRATNPNSLFANRANLVRPTFWRMLADITRFNARMRELVGDLPVWTGADRLPDQNQGRPGDARETMTIGHVLDDHRYSQAFIDGFLIPFGTAIWSADPNHFTQFPALSYARFMSNHGLLSTRAKVQWRTIIGGSRSYVTALTEPFDDRIRLSSPVEKVVPQPDGVVLVTSGHGTQPFDAVIVATHSDQALAMLPEATAEQHRLLSAIRYETNTATLHTDITVLPTRRRAWASWNSRINPAGSANKVKLTYLMNKLQPLPISTPLMVTLNSQDQIAPERVLANIAYSHPIFDVAALDAQRQRGQIQGIGGVYFAGAYFGYGFHEDGVQSGLEVARLVSDRSATLVGAR